MKKLLIINITTFGRLTDSYMWCKYLKDRFAITVICPDVKEGEERVEMEGIDIKFVGLPECKRFGEFCFLFVALWHCLIFNGSILVVYFRAASWLKYLVFWKKMTLDIRTFSVNRESTYRKKFNHGLIAATRVYDHVTIISNGLRDKINLSHSRSTILPLGSDPITSIDTSFDQLKLLYVGILSGRDIDKTIIGLKNFKDKYPKNKITYEIVGDGHYDELEELIKLTTSLGLNDVVKLHGRVPFSELPQFFDRSNIGVSFVPKTTYYEFQPPTKTFEYIISGLYTIATSTFCNKEIVTPDNGILIEDNSDEFTKALETISNNKENLDHKIIRESLSSYRWKNIVDNILYPIVNGDKF